MKIHTGILQGAWPFHLHPKFPQAFLIQEQRAEAQEKSPSQNHMQGKINSGKGLGTGQSSLSTLGLELGAGGHRASAEWRLYCRKAQYSARLSHLPLLFQYSLLKSPLPSFHIATLPPPPYLSNLSLVSQGCWKTLLPRFGS